MKRTRKKNKQQKHGKYFCIHYARVLISVVVVSLLFLGGLLLQNQRNTNVLGATTTMVATPISPVNVFFHTIFGSNSNPTHTPIYPPCPKCMPGKICPMIACVAVEPSGTPMPITPTLTLLPTPTPLLTPSVMPQPTTIVCNHTICKLGQHCGWTACPTQRTQPPFYPCDPASVCMNDISPVLTPTPIVLQTGCYTQGIYIICHTPNTNPQQCSFHPICRDIKPQCGLPDKIDFCPTTTPSTTIIPQPTCFPRPTCLDAHPACMLPQPAGGWCPSSAQPLSDSGVISIGVFLNNFLRGLLKR